MTVRETLVQPESTMMDCSSAQGPEVMDRERAMHLVDFSSGKVATGVGLVIWLIMVMANAYVIVTLAMGKGG